MNREYPGRAGAICNVYTPSDASNYLVLLKELRAQMDLEFPNSHKLLTAAVRVQPFDGPNGPMADVSAFAQYFDWVGMFCLIDEYCACLKMINACLR